MVESERAPPERPAAIGMTKTTIATQAVTSAPNAGPSDPGNADQPAAADTRPLMRNKVAAIALVVRRRRAVRSAAGLVERERDARLRPLLASGLHRLPTATIAIDNDG